MAHRKRREQPPAADQTPKPKRKPRRKSATKRKHMKNQHPINLTVNVDVSNANTPTKSKISIEQLIKILAAIVSFIILIIQKSHLNN
jgi:hypothetical protein